MVREFWTSRALSMRHVLHFWDRVYTGVPHSLQEFFQFWTREAIAHASTSSARSSPPRNFLSAVIRHRLRLSDFNEWRHQLISHPPPPPLPPDDQWPSELLGGTLCPHRVMQERFRAEAATTTTARNSVSVWLWEKNFSWISEIKQIQAQSGPYILFYDLFLENMFLKGTGLDCFKRCFVFNYISESMTFLFEKNPCCTSRWCSLHR